ncbi:Serine/threonine phosphatase stp [compost metagenome]
MKSPFPRPWHSAARTEAGKVRRRNEDAFLDRPEQGLWAVADGMGGHHNGALASRLIVEELARLPADGSLDQRVEQLRACLGSLNGRFGQQATVNPQGQRDPMGSTVVALLMDANRALCAWAGDSRCYLWRRSRLYQLSRDHSLARQLIEEQRMSPEQAALHPAARALTRAVGANRQLALEILEFPVLPGDTLLLCSDGLYQGLTPDALGAALNLPSSGLAITRLFDEALLGPAHDNLCAVVVRR